MSAKEQIIKLMQEAGYDLFTACEEYERIKSDFLASGDYKHTYYIRGGGKFTLCNHATSRS